MQLETIGYVQSSGPVPFPRVPAPHSPKDRVRSTLQRHVKMRSKFAVRPVDQVQEEIIDFGCLYAPKPESNAWNLLQKDGHQP